MNNLPQIASERGIDQATWSALNNSVFYGANPDSILLAWDYCRARNLDPLKKPCHIVPMNVKDSRTGQYSWRDVIMPGIYEQRITAFKTGQMVGQDEPVFGEMIQIMGITAPEWCKVTVYRFINGERCAFSHTEYFTEVCATKKDGNLNAMWTKRPRGQLAKCAEAGALRKAFPDELGGVMTAEEVSENNVSIDAMEKQTKSFFSTEKVDEIKNLIESTASDKDKFLAWLGIPGLDEMTDSQYARAKAALAKKAEKNKASDVVEAEYREVTEEDIPL